MRTNLVRNPSFEVDLTGWGTVAGAQIRATAYGTQMWAGLGLRSGGSMLQATSDGTNAYLTTQQATGQGFAVAPGQWVGVSALVASDIPAPGRVRVDVQCEGTATTYHAEPVNSPSTFYAGRRVHYAFQVPATAATARVRVQGFSGSTALLAATNRIWADNIIASVAATQAEALAAVTPYFDGDTPDTVDLTYSWSGAAHASTSLATATPGLRVERLPDAGAPQAGITVTGLAPSSESVISVQVSWDDGRSWHGVRGAERVTVTGGDFFRDHVPPLNVAARYRLVVHTGALTPLRLEDSITIESDYAWIQDPLNPRGAVQVECVRTGAGLMLMTGTAARILRRQAVDLTTVEGARYPVASVGVRQAPSGIPLALRAIAASQGTLINTMRDLLDSSGQVVIRGLPVAIPLDAVAHVTTGDVEEIPVIGGLLGFRNDWELSVTQVRPTSMRITIPWWTYDQVRALWSPRTYDAVKAARPGDTYIDWSRDPEVP
ncbi:hypothetical protein [Oerskovia sp. Root918]|uniref:hypothetical protein n=1 Tax=Oerskovia sp. Root918 TaxID=1736607 RepID=UPI000AFA152C|nr:hypothetical protein [Oerskovia sp. Root918]